MSGFTFGLVHAPLTPFNAGGIDYAAYGRLLDFHLNHGAEGLALPTHAGESVSLTVEERKALLEFAIGHVAGRAYVVANVSEAGTAIASDLAVHAKRTGAAAVIASVPYYWTPPQPMLVEHFAAIGEAGGLPLFVFNAPAEMNNVEFKGHSVVELIGRSPNFAGLIDASLDWQYMIEVFSSGRALRPDFQFVSGTEYMVSAGATGATGMLSALATVAPKLVRKLYDLCRAENYQDARGPQEDAAILFRAFQATGVAGLKAAATLAGRDCGTPRPPLPALDGADTQALAAAMASVKSTQAEPRGWA
ncbi:MAG: dihydrodipicolinate synthase family protein [Pseudomonadota bacterium]